jgi:bifunctional DNase/RNase
VGKLGAPALGQFGIVATRFVDVIEMELVGVRVELPSSAPIVLLREAGEHGRLLPIFIGGPEATAIALAMDDVETPRPMTHDLFKSVLDALAVTVQRVVVTDIQDKTFFAELEFAGADGPQRTVTSRPSDAIALAVRTGTPIFVEEKVLTKAGYTVPNDGTETGVDEEQVLEDFRDFIDSVDPSDFES